MVTLLEVTPPRATRPGSAPVARSRGRSTPDEKECAPWHRYPPPSRRPRRAQTDQPPRAATEQKVARLSAAAARRVVEPDEEVQGGIGAGQLLPDQLLSVAGLGLQLTADQAVTLSREEVASITAAGIRFEAVLEAGFAAHIATADDLTDPHITFILHEMGEETRHQRLFQRLLAQLDAKARSPFPARLRRLGYRAAVEASIGNPAFFYVLVLAGEEIPDLFQKRASEHPETDGFIRAVNRYHRMEEARHLSFARAVFGEVWAKARAFDRLLVRHVAPLLIRFMFDSMVDPGVYATIGLPAMSTWKAAKATAERQQFRHEATRPVLGVLLEAGALKGGRIPSPWRSLCGVGADGPAPAAGKIETHDGR